MRQNSDRTRTPDQYPRVSPGIPQRILGLDRCPETKTLRRKLRLLTSAEHTVRDWQSALARTWAAEHQDDWATLAVDDRVKVYAGRNGRLPKHFVAPEAVFAGVRELLDQRPGGHAPAVPAPAGTGWCRMRPPT